MSLRILYFTIILFTQVFPTSASSYNKKSEDIFEAVIQKGARLKRLKVSKEVKGHYFTNPRKVVVKARFKNLNSDYVLILDKKGTAKYSTHYDNIQDIQGVISLDPQVSPLEVYDKKATLANLEDGSHAQFSHFLSLTNFQGKSDFQPLLLGGTETATTGLLVMAKNYFQSPKLPLHLGVNFGFHRSSWKDPTVGSSSSQSILIGPSLMSSFFRTPESSFNTHLHFFQSIQHQMGNDPAPINLSTQGWQLDLEREFTWFDKPFFLAFNYRLTNSRVKSSEQVLAAPVESTPETSYGLTFGYRLNWKL